MHTQTQLKMNKDKILTLKNVTKSSIWELQENDVFRLWEAAEKDADLKGLPEQVYRSDPQRIRNGTSDGRPS